MLHRIRHDNNALPALKNRFALFNKSLCRFLVIRCGTGMDVVGGFQVKTLIEIA